jgi:hypothetical protein
VALNPAFVFADNALITAFAAFAASSFLLMLSWPLAYDEWRLGAIPFNFI